MSTPTMDSIVFLDPDSLASHPKNPRPASAFKKTNPKMRELIESVAEIGVFQPITVRVLANGTREVVAGHRRFHAARYAGKKVPAIIRDLDDATALAFMLAENIQREDTDPIMESRTIAVLIDEGKTLEAAAAKFGKSYGWAYKRAQLTNLSPKWIEAHTEGIITWSIDLLVIIARYATETQELLFDELVGKRTWTQYTVESLTEALGTYHHDIGKTQWDAEDADLLPEAGACTACVKRSSCQQTLFDDLKVAKKGPDHCTDHACWAKKAALHVERQAVALKEKHGVDVSRVSLEHARPEEVGVLGCYSFEKARRSDPGARPALVTDGPRQGATIWIKDRESGSSQPKTAAKEARDAGREPTKRELRAELEEKRLNLTKRRTLDAWHSLHKVLLQLAPSDKGKTPWKVEGKHVSVNGFESHFGPTASSDDDAAERYPLPKGQVPKTNALIAWVVMHGVYRVHCAQAGGLDAQQSLMQDKDTQHAMLWRACFATIKQELDRAIAQRDLDNIVPQEIASLIGVDLADLVAKSTEAIQEPKGWAVQYGDLLSA